MIPESIFEVTRSEYKSFVDQIKPECRRVEVEEINNTHTAAKIYSVNTGKCLCSRVAYSADYGEPEPEVYYIFELPEDYERKAPTPTIQLILDTKEEVQAFFDYVAKMRKENKKND